MIRALLSEGVFASESKERPQWVDEWLNIYRPDAVTDDAEWQRILRRATGNALAFVHPGKARLTVKTAADPPESGWVSEMVG